MTTPYEARKERKRGLMEQAENLQKVLDTLKFRLLVNQGEVKKATKRTEVENALLYELVLGQHLAHASMQAALTGHAQRSLNRLQPVQSVICLGTSLAERANTLMTLKDRQLDNAERYLAARSRALDLRSSYCHEERFDSCEDNYSVVRFETVPVRGANVKDVFEAMLGSVLNSEIFLSEIFGCVAVREDSDFETSEFAQLRLVTATSTGTTVESNTVVFSRFVDDGDDGKGSYGVLASDFVDVDALYPYRIGERVRRDGTTIVLVRELQPTSGKVPEVVVTRWTQLKLHRSTAIVSHNPDTELKESAICYGDTAKTFIQQQLVNATTTDDFP
ncbi:hypothetical protein PHYPSEUDO_014775 [Phytophthora pseudosyringae]|uniref:Uncharacterized protein n=1 Tax=Phytophthora pseudosyringae TaxID=221518 RepID=A0A8T1V4L1_9STRA|nr:hypothetical protein PHYPSEUDO_014775 [Phytophthora pseudosyringae]